MTRTKKIMTSALVFVTVVFAILVLASILGSRAEQTPYQILSLEGDVELRAYDTVLIAECEIAGEREASINKGFRVLAAYIFGQNQAADIEKSQAIAMTAPVSQFPSQGKWITRFNMPAGFTLKTLPKPLNQAITIREIPAKRFAVIRFSGIASETVLAEKTRQLEAFVQKHSLKTLAAPIYAFFNPPWTLPFMRRNEIMIEIAS